MMATPLKKKTEAREALMENIRQLEELGYKVRRFHSDRGSEFKSGATTRMMRERGIKLTSTHGGDSQANGRAEASIAKAKAKTRTLLASAGLPPEYWSFAMRSWNSRVWAREQEKENQKWPVGMWFGKPCSYRSLLTSVEVKQPFEDRGKVGMYLGPAPEQSGPGGYVLAEDGTVRRTNTVRPLTEEDQKEMLRSGWKYEKAEDGKRWLKWRIEECPEIEDDEKQEEEKPEVRRRRINKKTAEEEVNRRNQEEPVAVRRRLIGKSGREAMRLLKIDRRRKGGE